MNETEQTGLYPSFIETAENTPYIVNKLDVFKADGQTDKLVFKDKKQAEIAPLTTALSATDLDINSVHFGQDTVSAEIPLSQKLVNMSPMDLPNATKAKIAPRIQRTMQAMAFGKGSVDGDSETSGSAFQDIFQYNQFAEKVEDIEEFTTVEAMFADFANEPENLNEAFFVVNSAEFALGLVDVAGQPMMKSGNYVPGVIGYIYRFPVFVQDLNGKADMVLMNKTSYGYSVNDELAISINDGDSDSEVAQKGGVVIYGEIMAAGMVQNPSAIKVLKPVVGAVSIGEAKFVATSVDSAEVENPTVEIKAKKKTTRKAKND